MANELQVGQIVAQVEYSTAVPGVVHPQGPEINDKFLVMASGGPKFSTDITKRRDNSELRHVRWSVPLHTYNIDLSVWPTEELTAIRDLFSANSGNVGTFRFSVPIDNDIELEPIAYGDGLTTKFQITKTYRAGGRTFARKISKIVPGTLAVYASEDARSGNALMAENDDFGMDYNQGIISFVAAPESGAVIRVSCEFQMLGRFDNETMDMILHPAKSASLDSVTIQEVRR